MPTCASCGQDNPDIARFCLACGASLDAPAPPPPPSEERKLVTGVFVDVVGSTARSEELDPEDVRAMLGPYHARVKAELERYGGTVEKFIGDAVFALFGAPLAHEDDPERAVRAGLAILDGVDELNSEDSWLDLHIRVGITTGEALVMLDAKPGEGDWMAAGDVVNTAARIQSAAPVDGVLVGQLTYEATRHAIDYRDAEPIAAKGKAEPVPVWEVVGLRASPAPQRARLPLVGREAELKALRAVWQDVRGQGRAALVTVVAAPGIGKSRLLEELAEQVADVAAVHWGRCLSYGEGITYWPVIEIVKAAAGILGSDDAATTSLKLGALLESLPTDDADELRTMAAAVSNLVGAPTTPQGTYSAAEIGQAELHWGIRRLVELLATFRPLVLVFEDLHWAEPTLLELVQFLARGSAPFLVVGSARPEIEETAAAFTASGRAVVKLEALDAAGSEALLGRLLEGLALPRETAETLLRNAGGNPLFLEETVRMLEAAAAEGAQEIPVPTSLQSLIGSRLDQLPGGEKRLTQHASVVGAVFWPGAVAHLDGDDGDIDSGLDALERRDLIRAHLESSVAGEREYGFKHVLIRDVAYGRLPKGRRAGLHLGFAEWVSGLPGGDDDFVEIVGYHLEQSCRLAREVPHSPVPAPDEMAVAALTRAGEKSERREGIREADRFYQRALDLLGDQESEAALAIRLRRGGTQKALGELRRARDELAAVAEAAPRFSRPDLRGSALVALANIDYKQGRATEARERLTEAVAIASGIGDSRLRIQAVFELANLHAWFEGGDNAPLDDLREGVRIAEEVDDRALQVEGHMRMGFLLFNLGDLAGSEEHLSRCLALAGDAGSHRDEARVTFLLGLVKHYRDEPREAERLSRQALDWLERTGDSFFQIQNLRALALHALANGDLQLAEDRLRAALELGLEGGGWLVIETYRLLTETVVRQGRVDDARELVAFAARNVPDEDVYARAALLLAQACVATASGERSSATVSFEEALRTLEEQRLLIDLGEARVAFARALRSFGEPTGAQAELERARAIFKRMDARRPVREVDRELAELEGAGEPGPLLSA